MCKYVFGMRIGIGYNLINDLLVAKSFIRRHCVECTGGFAHDSFCYHIIEVFCFFLTVFWFCRRYFIIGFFYQI